MTEQERAELRRLFADYVWSEGCSCCRNHDKHDVALAALAKVLRIREYPGGIGYDVFRYRTEEDTVTTEPARDGWSRKARR